MELHPVGVSGILAVLGDAISEETGARVAALSAAVRDAHLSGVTEMIPAYASLLIKYDPFLTDYAALADRLRELERHISSSAAQEGHIVDIPVCYGGKYGEDLPFVARHAGLSEKDVIALHAGRTYRIYMLGFLPGFPYLGGLDSRLFTPRLDTPRTSIRWFRRHRRSADGHLPNGIPRRLAVDWAHAADALFTVSAPAVCGGRPHPVRAHRRGRIRGDSPKRGGACAWRLKLFSPGR